MSRTSSSIPDATARPSISSISRLPETAPVTMPRPELPDEYHCAICIALARTDWYSFHALIGALLPFMDAGTTEQPLAAKASAA